MNIRLIICTLLLLPVTAIGELYKSYDENGNIIYTDIPPSEEAKPINLPKGNITPGLKTSKKNKQKKNEFKYKTLKITSPNQDEVLNANIDKFNIKVSVVPNVNFKLGHKLQILLDGKVVSEGFQKAVNIAELERGSHSVTAQIIDKTNNVIKSSDTVNVHIRKHSQLFKKKSGI